jgi:hypothetical protein
MFNPTKLFKLKSVWDQFSKNHPKLQGFLQAAQKDGIKEGSIIEINIKTEDGKAISTNLKLLPSDMELLKELLELSK